MGMSINRVPQNGWFIRENPNLKWMITRGTPIYGNTQMDMDGSMAQFGEILGPTMPSLAWIETVE